MDDRRLYIGSSDAADIMSSDWSDLYAFKVGNVGERNLSRAFPVQLGLATEGFHLFWTTRALNEETDNAYDVSKWAQEPHTLEMNGVQHWASIKVGSATLGSHPDALIRHKATGQVKPMEVKITGRWENARAALTYYHDQVQHHLLCWGAQELLFSVICGTTEPERLWVGPSAEWQEIYLDRAQRFWWHVETRQPPGRQVFWGSEDETVQPQRVRDSVPVNGLIRRDIAKDNEAASLVIDICRTKAAAELHDESRDRLKALMKPNEGELYHPALTLKRNAKGAITLRYTKGLDEFTGSLFAP